MINKNDCLSILVKMEKEGGVNVDAYIKKVISSRDVPIEVLKFISANKGIEVGNFYEMLRKKHNQKKSPLYTNILKDTLDINEVITTLTCLLTQVVLYSNKLESNKESFLKEVRAEEITRVLNRYFIDGAVDSCVSLLKLIRSDLLVLEGISGRREFQK